MKFRCFEIRKPTILGKPPTEDYFKYNFDLVKWSSDHSHCWSIGFLHYRTNGDGFEFESVGLRYLEDREEGLFHEGSLPERQKVFGMRPSFLL